MSISNLGEYKISTALKIFDIIIGNGYLMHRRSAMPYPWICLNLDSLRNLAAAALVDNVYKATGMKWT
jgi:hypothetical protein